MVINLLYHFLSNLFRHMTIDVLVELFFFLCKPHWTHYFDQSGLAVQHVLVRVDPLHRELLGARRDEIIRLLLGDHLRGPEVQVILPFLQAALVEELLVCSVESIVDQ